MSRYNDTAIDRLIWEAIGTSECGLQRNLDEAGKWMGKSAAQGDADAANWLVRQIAVAP